MAVTARFQVSRVTPFGKPDDDWTQAEVEMTPDYAQGANAEWAATTPSGVFRLTIVRAVAELFKPGSKVAISMDITPGRVAGAADRTAGVSRARKAADKYLTSAAGAGMIHPSANSDSRGGDEMPATITLTPDSLELFKTLVEDAPNWSGMPLITVSPAEKGNLTHLKRLGLITTFVEDDGCSFAIFTDEGIAYAATLGYSEANFAV